MIRAVILVSSDGVGAGSMSAVLLDMGVVEGRYRVFVQGRESWEATISDIVMCGYLFPGREFVGKPRCGW